MIMLHSLNLIEPHDAQNDANTEVQKALEEQVVVLIRDNSSISKMEMSKKTGKSKATIGRFNKMINKGIFNKDEEILVKNLTFRIIKI